MTLPFWLGVEAMARPAVPLAVKETGGARVQFLSFVYLLKYI